jgi:peptide/nickel transport system permease protein
MSGYIIRRVIVAVIVTIGIAVITFLMLHYLQPSPVYGVLGAKAQPQAVAAWNQEHGFDRSEPAQLLTYLNNLIHLNFGRSYKLGQSVSALFKENAGRSAYLTLASLILALAIAIPLGIMQAVRRNTVLDYTFTTWNFVLYSMPSFFLGLILLQVFALDLHIFPVVVSDNVTTWEQAFLHPAQMTLPIVTLALIQVAAFSRYMRSSALDNLAQDYIRLARAKGLSSRTVLFRHLLRNACLPMITLIGLSLPALFAGNLLIEYLFNYPGLGLLFFQALGDQDYNILLAYTVLAGVLTVLGNLLADVAITIADPRVHVN